MLGFFSKKKKQIGTFYYANHQLVAIRKAFIQYLQENDISYKDKGEEVLVIDEVKEHSHLRIKTAWARDVLRMEVQEIKKDKQGKEIQESLDYDAWKQARKMLGFLQKKQEEEVFSHLFVKETFSINKLDREDSNRVYAQMTYQENLFFLYEITSLEKDGKNVEMEQAYYIQTNKRKGIIAWNKQEDVQWIPLAGGFELKERFTWNTILCGNYQFQSTLANNSNFEKSIAFFQEETTDEEKYWDLLFRNYSKKEVALEAIGTAYCAMNLFKPNMKSAFLPLFKSSTFQEKEKEDITRIFSSYFTSPDSGEVFIQILKDWEITSSNYPAILKEMLRVDAPDIAVNTLIFHELLVESTKENEAEVSFANRYLLAKHYARIGTKDKAIPLYEELLQEVPNESIQEFLPQQKENLFLTSDNSMKVSMLREFLALHEEGSVRYYATAKELLYIQPFQKELQDIVLQSNDALLVQKIFQIKSLAVGFPEIEGETYLFPKKEPIDTGSYASEVDPLKQNAIGGYFDSLKSVLASSKKPDYSEFIKYSEPLQEAKYPLIYDYISQIAAVFQMEQPECYIGRGKHTVGVMGLETNHPVLIIGAEHLDPSSNHYLAKESLVFLLALELANICNDFSVITSNDLWRGIGEKGYTVVEAVLGFIPGLSKVGDILGGITGGITFLEQYGTAYDSVKKVMEYAEKGTEYITPDFLQKKPTSQKDSLLVTSKLMQIIADRFALLFVNDLDAVVLAILHTDPFYRNQLDSIRHKGFYTFMQEEKEGDYVHQNFLFRFKQLVSFYLKAC